MTYNPSGTNPFNAVALDGTGALPAVSGANLTNLPGGGGGGGGGSAERLNYVLATDLSPVALTQNVWTDLIADQSFNSVGGLLGLVAAISDQYSTGATDTVAFGILIDGSLLIPVSGSVSSNLASGPGGGKFLPGLSAGSHTARIQAYTSSAGINLYIRAATHAPQEFLSLQVVEFGGGNLSVPSVEVIGDGSGNIAVPTSIGTILQAPAIAASVGDRIEVTFSCPLSLGGSDVVTTTFQPGPFTGDLPNLAYSMAGGTGTLSFTKEYTVVSGDLSGGMLTVLARATASWAEGSVVLNLAGNSFSDCLPILTVKNLSAGAGAPGTPLALVEYHDPSAVYTTSSPSLSDVDATNLSIQCVADNNGDIAVQLDGLNESSATGQCAWGLRESGTDVTEARLTAFVSTAETQQDIRTSTTFTIHGLVPGSVHTYQWAFASLNSVAVSLNAHDLSQVAVMRQIATQQGSGGQVAPGTVLAETRYAANTTKTTTSTALVDVDAANFVTPPFVAPASGSVSVDLQVLRDQSAGAQAWSLAVVTGPGSPVIDTVAAAHPTLPVPGTVRIPVSGLTPGSSYVLKWQWAVSSGTGNIYIADGTFAEFYGPALMTVIAR